MGYRYFKDTTSPSLDATLGFDVTGATVSLRLMASDGTLKVDAEADVAVGTAGDVSYPWAAGDLDTPGEFLAWWHVVLSTGAVHETSEFTVEVVEHGEPATGYLSIAELRSALRIPDENDDPELYAAIAAASGAIDHYTNRSFTPPIAATARYYTARWDAKRWRWVVDVDDVMTTTGLVLKVDTDGDGSFVTTLAINTDYRLSPYNAALDGRPWSMAVATSGVTLPCAERGVEVTARWGWTSIPAVVKQAARLQATRLFKRKDAPFGILGASDGSNSRLTADLDPDVKLMLRAVRRVWGAV